jgi:hypothetical protein
MDGLIPPRPRIAAQPLSWWNLARKELGLECNLSLKLGEVHKLLFPESKLHGLWHQAGADVLMTLDMINFYFRKILDQPQKGKIENYLSTACEALQSDGSAVERASVQEAHHDDTEDELGRDFENDWDYDDGDGWESDQDDWDSESNNEDYETQSDGDRDSDTTQEW